MKIKTDVRKIITKIVTFYAGEIGVEVELTIQEGVFSISREDIWVFTTYEGELFDAKRIEKELDATPLLLKLSDDIYSALRPYHEKKMSVTEMNNLIKKIKKIIVKTLDKYEK